MNPETIPVQIQLLLDSIDPDDRVLQEYVRCVVPNLIDHCATMSAKGGKAFLEHCRQHGYTGYHDKPDQSMVAHILNGIFPVMRIVRELEKRKLQQLNETEQKLYLLAYTLHDLDKIAGEKDLYDIGQTTTREHFTETLRIWANKLGIGRFFAQYLEFLDDLLYLIMNTQNVYGVDLFPYNYENLKLSARRRDLLRDLSNLSDVLNYIDAEGNLLTSPATICQDKLQSHLARLSDGQLRFSYHQLSTVTGLLTNLINNAIMRLMREQGHLPLLFFPNGVVYLAEARNDKLDGIADNLFGAVTQKISDACKQRLRQNLTGFTRDGKGLKFSNYYYQIFSLKELLGVVIEGANKIIHEKKKPVSSDRLSAMFGMQRDGGKWGIPKEIDLAFETSLDVDRFGEYLMTLEQILTTVPGITEVDTAILESLELSECLEQSRSIPDKGGIKYRWYFVAGKYLQQQRGLDREELNGVMRKTAQSVVDRCQTQLEQLEAGWESFDVLRSYLDKIVDLNGTSVKTSQQFAQEFEVYAIAKKSGRKSLMCSLCSSPYKTDRQQETAVPFQPQVYSNKQPLNKQADRRGICEICGLELMLRQILMKSRFQLTGGNFENQKVKYLYIYPGYYFTTETARYVARFYEDSLKHLNLFKVTKALSEFSSFTIQNLLELEDFQLEVEEDEAEKLTDRFLKMELPKNDLATFFFFGIPSFEREPTDTDSWIAPAFLALALPFVLTVKVVASEFPLPLYATGSEFRETVILDAPHQFLRHIFSDDRFRIDEIFKKLQTLTSVYRMHLDVFGSGGKPNWGQINEIAANLDTDRMYVFHYLMKLQRKQKWEGFPPSVVTRYVQLYQLLQREGDMAIFKELVDRYYKFYHPADFKSYNIHRPLSLVIDLTLKSDKELSDEDLILEMIGRMKSSQDLVHSKQAKGFAPIGGYDELAAIREFAEYFHKEVFQGYCHSERALLRDRANRIKEGCEAYYLETYAPRKKEK